MKLFLSALGILVLVSTVSAEEVTRKEGDTSLNFSLSRTELQQYKYGFGGKYWISSDIAYSGSFDVSDDEENTFASYGSKYTSDFTYYALSLALEKHFQTSSRLSPYIGGEMKCSRMQDKYTYEYVSSNSTSESTGKQYGAGVLVGAEYALNKNISFAGEYTYGFSYGVIKHRYTYTGQIPDEQTTRSRGFDLSVGRLTLLLYF